MSVHAVKGGFGPQMTRFCEPFNCRNALSVGILVFLAITAEILIVELPLKAFWKGLSKAFHSNAKKVYGYI